MVATVERKNQLMQGEMASHMKSDAIIFAQCEIFCKNIHEEENPSLAPPSF